MTALIMRFVTVAFLLSSSAQALLHGLKSPPALRVDTLLRRRSVVVKSTAAPPAMTAQRSADGESTAVKIDESSIPIPMWRGMLHRNGAFTFPLAAFPLLRAATCKRGVVHALFFLLAVQGIMSVSALLHTTDWSKFYAGRPEVQLEALNHGNPAPKWIRLADYSMIFIGIALCYSGLGGAIMGHAPIFKFGILPVVWGGAAAGVVGKIFALNTPRWVEAASFLTMGWAVLPGLGAIRATLTMAEWHWLFSGGLFFSVGCMAYLLQWPDFSWHRKYFRAHEAFHLGTMGGFFSLYMTILSRLPHVV